MVWANKEFDPIKDFDQLKKMLGSIELKGAEKNIFNSIDNCKNKYIQLIDHVKRTKSFIQKYKGRKAPAAAVQEHKNMMSELRSKQKIFMASRVKLNKEIKKKLDKL